jgi:mono/diheme cytochrome c family protein
MERHPRIFHLPAVSMLLLCACVSSMAQRIALHPTRHSADDLEITGLTPSPAYLKRTEILRLPQSQATVEHDPDFPGLSLHVSGVRLETLAKTLGVPDTDDLIDALCIDKYRSHYPADYIAQHHPILILRVEGETPAAWAAATHHENPGPYFIEHADFQPGFQALAHSDQRQVPTNVFRLNFSSTEATYGPLAPPGPATQQVDQGFTIAKQNCLRCHAEGSAGGTKSNVTWKMLAKIAKRAPDLFSRYMLNPANVNPRATMPGNPAYDEPTRAALTAYFQAITLPEPTRR